MLGAAGIRRASRVYGVPALGCELPL